MADRVKAMLLLDPPTSAVVEYHHHDLAFPY